MMSTVNSLVDKTASIVGILKSDFSLSIFRVLLNLASYHFFVNPFKSPSDVIIVFVIVLYIDRFFNRAK